MENPKKLTPLMQQYWEVKSLHEDKILFFRMGDFYELFDQDAILAAPILGIALTSRNKNHGDNTAMCGMPHHSVANYINKLLAHNFKVAICDQIEDPKHAKGIVKRAVTRILSPGMVYDPDTLNQTQNNYLCAYDEKYVSFLEATTGECFFYAYQNQKEQIKLINLLSPVEIVLSQEEYKRALENKKSVEGPCLTHHEITEDKKFKYKNLTESSVRLLSYAAYMQGEEIFKTLSDFEERVLSQRLEIHYQTLKHLEIFETYKGEHRGSFFSAINKTKTAAGSRKLKNWVLFPLAMEDKILERQNLVELWLSKPEDLKKIRSDLAQMGDIERRLGKISNPNCNARDFIALKESLKAGLEISKTYGFKDKEALKVAFDLIHEIEKTIVDEPPLSVREGYFVRPGYSADLDQLIKLTTDSQSLLSEMEQKEKEAHNIPSLKIRYNQVFGFYIEITKTHLDKVPKHYARKQTLTNAERFITDELYKLETQVLSARTKREEFEFAVFESLKTQILKTSSVLLNLAHEWSEVDVVTSLAWLALEHNYTRPLFSKDRSLKLEGARHPVIEQIQEKFIPNNLDVFPSGCLLLTGPNMAGKSTLMRQVALIAILAQIGSFVPAQSARLPLYDRIFTRIGASDSLTEGLSTFMVEMTETAFLLQNSTTNSLVILDEIGRGTSTYDGMSLAQAILEYLVTHVRSMTFFATHYHELTTLESRYPQIQNGHMNVAENKKDIQFLYTLEKGPANKSYGIEVAKLAGLPSPVIVLARKILEQKELQKTDQSLPLFSFQEEVPLSTASNLNKEWEKVISEIQNSNIFEMNPIQALQKIQEWQKSLN